MIHSYYHKNKLEVNLMVSEVLITHIINREKSGMMLLTGTEENTQYFTLHVGFIGSVQSSRILLLELKNPILNTFPLLYKFESMGFQNASYS